MTACSVFFFFFFFQAEDGIRDLTVTGVQTCALPISSLARTLVGVGVRSDPEHGPDVVRIDLRRGQAPTRVTAVNEDVLANKRLAHVEEVWYPSSGGTRVQGWIVKPPAFDPPRKHPLIIELH